MFDRNNTIISTKLKTVESIKGAKKGLQVHHPIEPWIYLKESKTRLSGNLEEELMKELYDVFTIFDEDDKIIAVATENLILSFDYFDSLLRIRHENSALLSARPDLKVSGRRQCNRKHQPVQILQCGVQQPR